jgi:hypothetical protein
MVLVQKPVLCVESAYIDRLRLTAIPTPAMTIMAMAGHAALIDAQVDAIGISPTSLRNSIAHSNQGKG